MLNRMFGSPVKVVGAVLLVTAFLALTACDSEDEETAEAPAPSQPIEIPPAEATGETPAPEETAALPPATSAPEPEEAVPPFGQSTDMLYAGRLWIVIAQGGALTSDDAVHVEPYQGQLPHGEVVEIIRTRATLGIHEGELIVKRNHYGDGEGITEADVAANPTQFLDSVTIMFQREAGYDPENGDWFWAKFTPEGRVMNNDAGIGLAGRVALGMDTGCIACHTNAPGDDLVFSPPPGGEVASVEPAAATPPAPAPEEAEAAPAPAPEDTEAAPAPAPEVEETAAAVVPPFGQAEDVAFADQIWALLDSEAVTGPDAQRSEPYQGSLPHGEILEIARTQVDVDGRAGELWIKWNYLGDAITMEMVDADPDAYLDSVTIMFQREAGYDSENGDWFWAKFMADGSLAQNPAGLALAGRVARGMDTGCIACHTAAPGEDLVFTEPLEDMSAPVETAAEPVPEEEAAAPAPEAPAAVPIPEAPAAVPIPEDEAAAPAPEETAAAMAPPFGQDEDMAYADQIWGLLDSDAVTGPDARRSEPYQGSMPHGEILEILNTRAEVEGREGELWVKWNYLGDGITMEMVDSDPDAYLDSVTVMFQREAGYDPENGDWFWAKFMADGSFAKNPAGLALVGRVARGMDTGCIACHTGAPGEDLVFTEPLGDMPAPVETAAAESMLPTMPEATSEVRAAAPATGGATPGSYDYVGTATSYGGRTLELRQAGGTSVVTLWGLTVPDLDQWPWGPWARTYIDALLRGEELGCVRQPGAAGIHVRCYIISEPDRAEINALVVEAGFAVEDRTVTGGAYSEQERRAQEARLNLWQDWVPGR